MPHQQVMIAAYVQTAVTAIYASLFILSPEPPSFPRSMTVFHRMQNSFKTSIRVVLEFSRQLCLALVISAAVITSDTRKDVHTVRAVTYAATTFSMTVLILEMIFWEWYRPKTRRHFFIPGSFFIALVYLIGRSNSYQQSQLDASGPFYKFCYDFGKLNMVASQLHAFAIPTQGLASVTFGVWVMLRYKQQRNNNLRRLARVFQTLVLLLLLSGLGMLLFSFSRFRDIIAISVGATNREAAWSFGQIVLLTTWVPVVIEFVLLVSCRGE